MAVFIPGQSICILCNKIVISTEEAIAFPAFIPPNHDMSKYSDCVFHRTCFEAWDGNKKLLDLYERYQEVWHSRPVNLKSMEEIEEWGKNAFRDVFNPLLPKKQHVASDDKKK